MEKEWLEIKGHQFLILLWEKEKMESQKKQKTEEKTEKFYQISGEQKILIVVRDGDTEVSQQEQMERILYSGSMLVGMEFIKDYGEGLYSCISYRHVLELIFENGRLTTRLDHSRSMYRIRKNIDVGFRDLMKKKDEKVIRKFLKKTLVGKYTKQKKKWFPLNIF